MLNSELLLALAILGTSIVWTMQNIATKYIKYLSASAEIVEDESEERNRGITIMNILGGSISKEVINKHITEYVADVDMKLDSTKPPGLDIPENFDRNDTPIEYICPISKSIMRDPVISSDGYTYERSCIERHLSIRGSSPATNNEILFPYLIPNWNLRTLIVSYVDKIKNNIFEIRNFDTEVVEILRSSNSSNSEINEFNVEESDVETVRLH